MSKPWGGVGAWALDVEIEEAEEREQAAAFPIAGAAPQSFPSLKESMATKPKKKKGIAMSLSQFTTGAYTAPGAAAAAAGRLSSETKGLTTDEMLRLPTGPRDRTPEELEHRGLGGGFRSYGPRGGEGDASWGSAGGGAGGGRRSYGGNFDDDQRRGPGPEQLSSRADDVDNWATGKKSFTPSTMDSGRGDRDRYSSLGSGSASRADDAGNWSLGKKQVVASRNPGFGSGFRDSFGASDSDRWARGGAPPLQTNNGDRERPRLVLDPPKGNEGGGPPKDPKDPSPVSTNSNPFGAARPREEVLAEKGLDWRKFDSDIEVKKTSRPSSAQSDRTDSLGSLAAGGAEGAPVNKPKVNPFGDAKPREVLLQERGKDWRKIDLELENRRVDRQETEEEKLLKEEVKNLKKALTEGNMSNLDDNSAQVSEEEVANLRAQLVERENQLELLTRDLDDKLRFSVSVDSRSSGFMERPRSRGGIGDSSANPVDDRRGFRGDRDSSFFGSRNMERPKSREKW